MGRKLVPIRRESGVEADSLVTAAGTLEIIAVWLVWLGLLTVVAVSILLSIAGVAVFAPMALVHRRAHHSWPSWAPRLFAYVAAAAVVAVPASLLLARVVTA